jgi:uncharacterized membrane protein
MNNKLRSDTNTCSICNTEMPADVTHCSNCKAHMIKGYIDASARKSRRMAVITLLIASALTFYYLYPTTSNPPMLFLAFALSIVLSFIFPYIYYRVKNKNNIIWKRKAL